jgi:hypothetical protein
MIVRIFRKLKKYIYGETFDILKVKNFKICSSNIKFYGNKSIVK